MRSNTARVGEEPTYRMSSAPLNSDATKLFGECNELLESAWTTRMHGNMDYCRERLTLLHKRLGDLYDAIEPQRRIARGGTEWEILPIQKREW